MHMYNFFPPNNSSVSFNAQGRQFSGELRLCGEGSLSCLIAAVQDESIPASPPRPQQMAALGIGDGRQHLCPWPAARPKQMGSSDKLSTKLKRAPMRHMQSEALYNL